MCIVKLMNDYRWKCVLNRVTTAAAEMALETEQAQSACDDLYLKVRRDMGNPAESADRTDNREKLRLILEKIMELRKILKVARERVACNYSNRPNSVKP